MDGRPLPAPVSLCAQPLSARAVFAHVVNLRTVAAAFYFCLLVVAGRKLLDLQYEALDEWAMSTLRFLRQNLISGLVLLATIAAARLFTTVTRLKERLGVPPPRLDAVLPSIAPATAPKNYLRWINASVGQNLRLITVDEIVYFQADNKYTRVVTADGEALIRKPLKELVDELDPNWFWQIRRSTMVNVGAVAGVTRDFRGRMLLKLKDRSEMLQVSDSYTHLFRQM